jgi:hypothetical protein
MGTRMGAIKISGRSSIYTEESLERRTIMRAAGRQR